MDWLDDAWVAASARALAERAGGTGAGGTDQASGTVAVETNGAGGGSYWRTWVDGVAVAGGSGKPTGPADLTLSLADADARAFWRGEWSPSVAFMRGRLKMAGSMSLLLPLLADIERWVDAGPRSVVEGLAG